MLPFLFLVLLAGCSRGPAVWRFQGSTMGTTYHVTVVDAPEDVSEEALDAGIEQRLETVNRLMSTYRDDSEVSIFNRMPAGDWVPVSSATAGVVAVALDIYRLSGGAFDVTVGPLVDLWGFGARGGAGERVPGAEEIEAARALTGSDALHVRFDPAALMKDAPRQIDLSAIAKGFGVDEVAHWLEQQGVRDYMVEVGGEVRAAGRNPRGEKWRIGIEAPELLRGQVARAIGISAKSVATSGDYRNYFEVDGKRYSHTIDPATGRPVEHALASVTVVSDNCTLADALATAIDVMGPERGMALAEREGIAVFMLVRKADGAFEARSSPAFSGYVE